MLTSPDRYNVWKTEQQLALLTLILSLAASFCSPVPVPANGTVQGYRYELGATLRITCNEGYNMVPASSAFRTCISDGKGGGQWSETDPVCECKGFMINTYYLARGPDGKIFGLRWCRTDRMPKMFAFALLTQSTRNLSFVRFFSGPTHAIMHGLKAHTGMYESYDKYF